MAGKEDEPTRSKKKFFRLWDVIDDENSAIEAALSTQIVAFYISLSYFVNLAFLFWTGTSLYGLEPTDQIELFVQAGLMLVAIALSLWLGFKIRRKFFSFVPGVFIWLVVEIIIKFLSTPYTGTGGIVVAFFVGMVGINGLRGWFALRKYKFEEPEKPRRNWWLITLGSIASIIVVLLFAMGALIEIGVLPDAKVIAQENIPNYQRQVLVDNSIVKPSDEIEYLYSEGLFSVLDGGQLLTPDRLISYATVDGELAIYEMPYEAISEIELVRSGSSIEDSFYKIHGNIKSPWEYITILLPVEDRGDEIFIEALSRNIEKHR